MNAIEKPIVVVGNGPSVMSEDHGELIDSFPTVVRINDYITEGYERKVGSKITHWVTGAGHQSKIRARPTHGIESFLAIPLIKLMNRAFQDIERQVSENLFMDIFDFNIISLKILKSIHSMTGIKNPSTGLLTLALFGFHLTSGPVYYTGFDGFTTKRHYYDNVGDVAVSKSHDWEMERIFIMNQAKQKRFINLKNVKELSGESSNSNDSK